MSTTSPAVRFEYEWEPAEDVRSAEFASTWARLEMWVGDRCVTQVEDAASRSARRSIYCPLYPLAEWIAFNWWALEAYVRPSALEPEAWSYSRLAGRHSNDSWWLRRQNMRAAGDGFLWPNLAIIPEGEVAHVAWFADAGFAPSGLLRFTQNGEALVERAPLMSTLSLVVESVLTRLAESGVSNTSLSQEWDAINQVDVEERDFCLAAARLGLDPYGIEEGLARLIELAAEHLDSRTLDEFLGSANPWLLEKSLKWVDSAGGALKTLPSGTVQAFQALQSSIDPAAHGMGLPWERGWAQAHDVRSALDLGNSDRLSINELIDFKRLTAPDLSFEGLGGRSDAGGGGLVLSREQFDRSARFAGARSLWHFLYEPERERFLLTAAHTDYQRVERAFAAEILAPAAGVEEMFGPKSYVYFDELERVANHFDVSTRVIWHQAENQLALDVVE